MQFCVLKTWSLKGIRVLVWSSLLGFLLWVIGLAIVIDVLIVFLVTLRCVYIVAIGNLTVGVLVAVMTGSFPGTSLGVCGVGAKQEAAILQLQLGQAHSLLFYCLKTCPKCVNEAGPWSQNSSCSQDPYHPERSSHIWQPGVPQSRILNNNPRPGLHIISWASSLLLSRPDKDISLVFICKLFWRPVSDCSHHSQLQQSTARCNRAHSEPHWGSAMSPLAAVVAVAAAPEPHVCKSILASPRAQGVGVRLPPLTSCLAS